MKVSYPALFYYDNEQGGYFVTFPDFIHSATQGDDIPDAMEMASDYLGITIASYIEDELDIPPATNINSLSVSGNYPFEDDEDDQDLKDVYDIDKSFVSMVTTEVSDYLEMDKPIKKTLTIPKWADKLGKEMNINFSQTLTDAIAEIKIKS